MNRREFLNRITFGTLLTGGVLATTAALKVPVPRTGYDRRLYPIGDINHYAVNHFTFLPERNIFIYRDRKGVKAISAVCTHLGCILQKSETGFHCPCHGSRFDIKGEILSGPAVRKLDWFAVNREPDGRIVVNEDITVSPRDYLKI